MHPSIHLNIDYVHMQSNMPGAVGDKGMSQKAVPILAFWRPSLFPLKTIKHCSCSLLGFHWFHFSSVIFLSFFWSFFFFFKLLVSFSAWKMQKTKNKKQNLVWRKNSHMHKDIIITKKKTKNFIQTRNASKQPKFWWSLFIFIFWPSLFFDTMILSFSEIYVHDVI